VFHNFLLHESLQYYSESDISHYQGKLNMKCQKKTTWYRWTQYRMGSTLSPYSSVQFCYLAEEFARDNNMDKGHALRWDYVILNLPGSQSYNPSKPRVYKWNGICQKLAGDVIFFVDDGRVTGHSVILGRLQDKSVTDSNTKGCKTLHTKQSHQLRNMESGQEQCFHQLHLQLQ
jgi:hypothetical protein